jgi:long-chain acyl-CoA synthetase
MQDGVLRKSERKGLVGSLLRLTLWAAREVYEAKKQGRSPSMLAAIAYGGTAGVRAKIKRQLFGRAFRFAISGGAKLQIATNEFFDALDIMVLEGYGLTETVVATNINRPNFRKIGTVGPLLASDIQIKIAEDGEICFKGPNIALGYYNRPTATSQSWDEEGWFHTGDLGSIDDKGLLSIQGRKKELIVTAGGKKIPPDPIEQRLKLSRFVSQVMLFGDEKPYCIALITLNLNAAEIWAHQHGKSVSPQLVEEEVIRKEVWEHVQKINAALASYESVKKIRLIAEDFSIENGLLTPTLKVRRREVVKRYRDLIEEIYSSEREW